MKQPLKNFSEWLITERYLSPQEAEAYARKHKLKVKDKTPNHPSSELTSASEDPNKTGEISSLILDIASMIAKDIENEGMGIITITAGNDKFHKDFPRSKSRHPFGMAIDFVLQKPTKKNIRKTVKILKKYVNRYYGAYGFKFVDEYTKPTPHATGGHFHIAIAHDPTEARSPQSFDKATAKRGHTHMKSTGALPKSTVITNFTWPPNQVLDWRKAVRMLRHEAKQNKVINVRSRAQVAAVQSGLIQRGYDLPVHGIDGRWGPETRAAVQAFQRDRGIAVDGIVGIDTLTQLLKRG